MSLDWDVREVKKYKELCWHGEEVHRITENIIFATMFTGINHITEHNWAEFYVRHCMWSGAHGALPAFGAVHVRAHVGLRTNASSISREKFAKTLVEDGMKANKNFFDTIDKEFDIDRYLERRSAAHSTISEEN